MVQAQPLSTVSDPSPAPGPTVVAAAFSHVGNVRQSNQDACWVDVDTGAFLVCDGMGGHAAGEVASGLAVSVVRERWTAPEVRRAVQAWASVRTPDARRTLFRLLRDGVLAAHDQIIDASEADAKKRGMGTTFVGLHLAGAEAIIAHAGDSRAYLVRDGNALLLTEDHTLLARLAAAGVETGDGSRWKGVLTNALGIGEDTRVALIALPLATGDRFLLCSDGITEYVSQDEIGAVLSSQPSPGRAAQRLIDLALERGGADNATAVVLKLVEAGDPDVPAARRWRDDAVLATSRLLGALTAPQRLRSLRVAVERELPAGERVAASAYGDRVAWLLLEGEVETARHGYRAGELLYPESLLPGRPPVGDDRLGIARTPVRALVIRRDDFGELTVEEPDLAEPLFQALASMFTAGGSR